MMNDSVGIASFLISSLFSLAVTVFVLVAQWKVFTKAGKPGWTCLIPIYNLWVMGEIIYGEGWKGLLSCLPVVQWIVWFRLPQVFGMGTLMGIVCALCSPVAFAVIGFGKAEYQGPFTDSFI